MSKVRMQSRRAASKEALKQMHILLDDQETLEIPDDEDDDEVNHRKIKAHLDLIYFFNR